jgi:SAM-dependent methyltransferase
LAFITYYSRIGSYLPIVSTFGNVRNRSLFGGSTRGIFAITHTFAISHIAGKRVDMASPAISSPEWYLKVKDASSDIDRLTIYHYGFKQAAEGTLIFAPLDFSSAPRAVLDVGTADGLWMRDVQSSIPSPPHGTHAFTGTDINQSFFPTSSPSTIRYIKQDIKAPLPPSWQASFDLVNLRMILIAAGSGSAQRTVINEHIKLVKPGGWIQIGDCDRICPTPVAENPHYHDMFACIRAVCQASGADPLEAPKMKKWLEEAGLQDVQERTAMRAVGKRNVDQALGSKGIEADLIIAQSFANAAKSECSVPSIYEVCEAISLTVVGLDLSVKPLPDEKLDRLVVDLEQELSETGAYFPMRFIWGRKPQ